MGRVCVGRLCYGPSLQWAEFAMGRDVQLPAIYVPAVCGLRGQFLIGSGDSFLLAVDEKNMYFRQNGCSN